MFSYSNINRYYHSLNQKDFVFISNKIGNWYFLNCEKKKEFGMGPYFDPVRALWKDLGIEC